MEYFLFIYYLTDPTSVCFFCYKIYLYSSREYIYIAQPLQQQASDGDGLR